MDAVDSSFFDGPVTQVDDARIHRGGYLYGRSDMSKKWMHRHRSHLPQVPPCSTKGFTDGSKRHCYGHQFICGFNLTHSSFMLLHDCFHLQETSINLDSWKTSYFKIFHQKIFKHFKPKVHDVITFNLMFSETSQHRVIACPAGHRRIRRRQRRRRIGLTGRHTPFGGRSAMTHLSQNMPK